MDIKERKIITGYLSGNMKKSVMKKYVCNLLSGKNCKIVSQITKTTICKCLFILLLVDNISKYQLNIIMIYMYKMSKQNHCSKEETFF